MAYSLVIKRLVMFLDITTGKEYLPDIKAKR